MRNYDIESLIENAFLAQLPIYIGNDVTIESWDDIKVKSLTPMVKVKAQTADDLQGAVNYMPASYVLVDFGIFTSKRQDETGRQANAIRGAIRELLNQTTVVDLLSAVEGLSVYNNGVIPQGSSNNRISQQGTSTEDSKLWQKNLSVLIIANTESV